MFYEYVWESKEEFVVKDDLLLPTPRLLYPEIFCDSTIYGFLVKIYPCMFLLLIIHRIHRMSVCHLIVERTNISSQIYQISYLSFSEIHRVKKFISHHPPV